MTWRLGVWCVVFWAMALAAPTASRYEHLLTELRCLVCQNQNLLDSEAPLAKDLKEDIHRLIRDGQTDEEIKAYLTQRYGEFILFKPLVKPTTWVLWFGPFVLLCVGLIGVWIWAKRGRQHA